MAVIAKIGATQDNLEDGEQPPSQKAMDDLKTLIAGASQLRASAIIGGDVVPYFGELSITWRAGDRVLRATSFSDDRLPRLDFGITPVGSLGEYDFLSASPHTLVEKLAWLDQEFG